MCNEPIWNLSQMVGVHPTLTRLSKFFHHDEIYARKLPLPLCVYSLGQQAERISCSLPPSQIRTLALGNQFGVQMVLALLMAISGPKKDSISEPTVALVMDSACIKIVMSHVI